MLAALLGIATAINTMRRQANVYWSSFGSGFWLRIAATSRGSTEHSKPTTHRAVAQVPTSISCQPRCLPSPHPSLINHTLPHTEYTNNLQCERE